MVGEHQTRDLLVYLSRLTGETLSVGDTVRLRSVHRAALSSWARKQGIALRTSVLSGGEPFIIADLVGEHHDGQGVAPTAVSAAVAASAWTPPAGVEQPGIGIDIEDVDALPEADDYREHPFYRDNFTQIEIAYCLRQADVRASLCGTWAAKEAIVKSGIVTAEPGQLRTVTIARDAAGRPLAAGCQISISHTARTAVAVCMPLASGRPAAPALPLPLPEPERASPVAANAATRNWPVAAAIALVLVGAATFGLHSWVHFY